MINKPLCSLLSVFLLFVAGIAESSNNPAVSALLDNDKIIRASSVLAPFSSGADKVKVIVTLRPTAKAAALHNQSLLSSNNADEVTQQMGPSVYYDLNNESIRTELNQIVSQKLNAFTAGLSRQDINVSRKFNYVFGFAAEVTATGLASLVNDPDVLSVEEDLVLTPQLRQGISLMNGNSARNSYNGAGVAVAVTDTGIDYTHPRLGGGGFPNSKVLGGYDFGENDSNPIPSGSKPNAHGTAAAGIIAGSLGSYGDYVGGVAPAAKLYALKISNDTNHSASSSAMIAAWEWALTHKNDNPANPILVINTSFGGGEYSSACDSANSSMTQAAANAVAAGISIFVSSGNSGLCNGMGWPACISHVNSVGAVYDAAIGQKGFCVSANSCATKSLNSGCPSSLPYAVFDNTAADKVTGYSNSASFLTFFASSNDAYTTDIKGLGGYASGDYTSRFGGTSAAAPYASGSAAVLQHAAKLKTGSYLTPAQVKSYFQSTGRMVTDSKVAVTKPRINLGAAVAALPTSGANTPDLVVSSLAVSRSSLTVGQSFTISATVRNQGNRSSASTTLRYYLSTDSTITTSDQQISTDPVGALSQNATSNESTSATAPGTAATYWIGACVDSVSGENNTGNNCSFGDQIIVTSTGGGNGDSFEPDGTSGQASSIQPGRSQMHSISPVADVDWVKFTLNAPRNIILETAGDSGDTVLYLYNGSLTQIATNDDGGNGYFSRISLDALPAGTYYAKVREYGDNDEIASYTLLLTTSVVSGGSGGDSFEPDNQSSQASSIFAGIPQTHSIVPVADVDWVRFTLSRQTDIVLQTSGTRGDTVLFLYNSSLSEIASDDDSGEALFSKIILSNLQPGTYYAKIIEYRNNDQISSYTLSLDAGSNASPIVIWPILNLLLQD
jgi:hypothetical protein